MGHRWRAGEGARDRGASAVEYAVIVFAVAAVVTAAVFMLGRVVDQTFTRSRDCLVSQTAPACP